MGFAKFRFDANDEELSRFARALSLPVRVSMLKVLINEKSWASNEVFKHLSLTPVTRDRHLQALKDLGIVIENRQNRIAQYQINEAAFQKLIEDFKSFFDLFETFWINSHENIS